MNLVFASGVLVPQHLLQFDYFRGVREAFPGSLFPHALQAQREPSWSCYSRPRRLAFDHPDAP
jgi:hypothetical protein